MSVMLRTKHPHAKEFLSTLSQARCPTDRPSLPRILTFELIVNELDSFSMISVASAVQIWGESPGPKRDLIVNAREVGCAINRCSVRTVSLTFICRPYLDTAQNGDSYYFVCMYSQPHAFYSQSTRNKLTGSYPESSDTQDGRDNVLGIREKRNGV